MKERKIVFILILFVTIGIISSAVLTKKSLHKENKKLPIELYDGEAMIMAKDIQDSIDASLKNKYGNNYQEKIELNALAVESAAKVEKIMAKEKVSNNYPNYYGGMYINDSEKLVIQIVEDKIPLKTSLLFENYNDITTMDNIEIEYVKKTYNELESLNKLITDYFIANANSEINITGNYIDVYSNKVVVELESNTEQEQKKFKDNITSSELITFKKGERTVTAMNSGQGFYKGSDLQCTLGFRAKLNNKAGFVTAGHCVKDYSIGASYLGYGTLRKSIFKDGATADAAFIETNTTVNNTLEYPAGVTTSLDKLDYPQTYTVGTLIGKVGGETKGTIGKITAASKTLYVFDPATGIYALPDQVDTNVIAKGGDSGGPVFTNLKNGVLIGIVQGTTNQTNEMNFSKYTNIKSNLGIVRY